MAFATTPVSDCVAFKGPDIYENPVNQRTQEEPVKVEGGEVVFRPVDMALNKFYCVELNGKPYLYRRVSDHKVEVYGLAD